MLHSDLAQFVKFFPLILVQQKGLHGLPRLVMFTSKDSHYSIQKLAAFEGLGSDNVYSVKTDSRGKMDTQDLEKQILEAIAEKAVPFMVSATSGIKTAFSFVMHQKR